MSDPCSFDADRWPFFVIQLVSNDPGQFEDAEEEGEETEEQDALESKAVNGKATH